MNIKWPERSVRLISACLSIDVWVDLNSSKRYRSQLGLCVVKFVQRLCAQQKALNQTLTLLLAVFFLFSFISFRCIWFSSIGSAVNTLHDHRMKATFFMLEFTISVPFHHLTFFQYASIYYLYIYTCTVTTHAFIRLST